MDQSRTAQQHAEPEALAWLLDLRQHRESGSQNSQNQAFLASQMRRRQKQRLQAECDHQSQCQVAPARPAGEPPIDKNQRDNRGQQTQQPDCKHIETQQLDQTSLQDMEQHLERMRLAGKQIKKWLSRPHATLVQISLGQTGQPGFI